MSKKIQTCHEHGLLSRIIKSTRWKQPLERFLKCKKRNHKYIFHIFSASMCLKRIVFSQMEKKQIKQEEDCVGYNLTMSAISLFNAHYQFEFRTEWYVPCLFLIGCSPSEAYDIRNTFFQHVEIWRYDFWIQLSGHNAQKPEECTVLGNDPAAIPSEQPWHFPLAPPEQILLFPVRNF